MRSRRNHREPARGDWLDGCLGFLVEAEAGRIGRVADVRRDGESGRAVALVVRAGMAGTRRLLIPVDDIAGVLPSSRRIILNGAWAPMPDEQAGARMAS
jgi:hypothetical protein